MYLLQCPACHQIYKCTKYKNEYITDFGDKLNHCLKCGNNITKSIQTEDWIADLVFKVKGN